MPIQDVQELERTSHVTETAWRATETATHTSYANAGLSHQEKGNIYIVWKIIKPH